MIIDFPDPRLGSEPPLLRCKCGREWRWKWHERKLPSGQAVGWCAPKLSPCELCAPSPALEVERAIRERLRRAGVPEPLWSYRFDRAVATSQGSSETDDAFWIRVRSAPEGTYGVSRANREAVGILADWTPGGAWPLITGPAGAGKTTILAMMARRLLEEPPLTFDGPAGPCPPGARTYRRDGRGRRVQYIRLDELVRRQAIARKGMDESPVLDAARSSVLLLDELGLAAQPRDYEVDIFENLLCERFDRRRPTVLVTNRSIGELAGPSGIYGNRVADRIRACLEVRIGGPSWR